MRVLARVLAAVAAAVAGAVVTGVAGVAGVAAGAAEEAGSSTVTLACGTSWSIAVPAADVPTGVTLTSTPTVPVPRYGVAGAVCTIGPAGVDFAQPAVVSADGLAPFDAYLQGFWLGLPLLVAVPPARIPQGFVVTHTGTYGEAKAPAGQLGVDSLSGTPGTPVLSSEGNTLTMGYLHRTDLAVAGDPGIVGIGDRISMSLASAGQPQWICDGDNGPIAGGTSQIALAPPAQSFRTVGLDPTQVTNATVSRSATDGVTWHTVAPTGGCSQPPGPDGLLPVGTYRATFQVTRAPTAAPSSWSESTASLGTDMGGIGLSAPTALVGCTCDLVPASTAYSAAQTVPFTGANWLAGTVTLVLGDAVVGTVASGATFSGSFTVPAVLSPPTGGQLRALQLWALGPGGHDLVRAVTLGGGAAARPDAGGSGR